MLTKQNYSAQPDNTTSSPQSAKNGQNPPSSPDDRPLAIQASSGVTFLDENTIRVDDQFGDSLASPLAINQLRQELRAWFMAYIPVWESSFATGSLEESIYHYQTLDQFLSSLIEAGINRQKGGQEHA